MSTAFAEGISQSRPQNLSSDQDDDQGADEKINVDYQESMWKIGRGSWPMALIFAAQDDDPDDREDDEEDDQEC